MAARRLIAYIKRIQPDIIHMHALHGYYLNYPFFEKYPCVTIHNGIDVTNTFYPRNVEECRKNTVTLHRTDWCWELRWDIGILEKEPNISCIWQKTWKTDKIEKMCRIMEENPAAKCACCKFELIDEQGQDIHSVMTPTRDYGTGEVRKVPIEEIFYKCQWPGMVMAYSREWYESWTKGNYQIPHDFLIAARR